MRFSASGGWNQRAQALPQLAHSRERTHSPCQHVCCLRRRYQRLRPTRPAADGIHRPLQRPAAREAAAVAAPSPSRSLLAPAPGRTPVSPVPSARRSTSITGLPRYYGLCCLLPQAPAGDLPGEGAKTFAPCRQALQIASFGDSRISWSLAHSSPATCVYARSCSYGRAFAPRFLQQKPHSPHLALHYDCRHYSRSPPLRRQVLARAGHTRPTRHIHNANRKMRPRARSMRTRWLM
jgi:hypothetical protein